jgi:hypothetical protein
VRGCPGALLVHVAAGLRASSLLHVPCSTVACQDGSSPAYVTVAYCQRGAADLMQGVCGSKRAPLQCSLLWYLRHACLTAQCVSLPVHACVLAELVPGYTQHVCPTALLPAGLTLVRASNVFLLEPALDPAIEQQAVARVHRIGQQRPVHITRLLMRDSVEMEVSRRVLPAGLAGQAATCSQACSMQG